MWFASPEVNESDAIVADQLRTYQRQIEDCELATPISHWDGAQSGWLAGCVGIAIGFWHGNRCHLMPPNLTGFSGLVRVSDEPLALLLQNRTRQPENQRAAAEQEATPAASPFAAATAQRRSEDGAPPSGSDPLQSMLESARSLLTRGKRQEAGTVLQAVLASAPFKRVDVSREAIAMVLEARGYADERPQGASSLSPRQVTLANKEIAAAFRCLARCERLVVGGGGHCICRGCLVEPARGRAISADNLSRRKQRMLQRAAEGSRGERCSSSKRRGRCWASRPRGARRSRSPSYPIT